MSIFEDMIIRAKELGTNIGDKTTKAASIAKLRLSSAELSADIAKRFEALGRVVYETVKADGDLSTASEESVKGIDALYSRLDDVNKRIASLKNKNYCKTCGAAVDRNAIYCSRCGSCVETQDDENE